MVGKKGRERWALNSSMLARASGVCFPINRTLSELEVLIEESKTDNNEQT